MANKLKKKNVHILPGYKLCRECIKVFEEIDSTDDDADNDDDDDDEDDDANNDDDDDDEDFEINANAHCCTTLYTTKEKTECIPRINWGITSKLT